MKNIFSILLFGSALSFSSCGVADYTKSADAIAEYCGTEEVSVGSTFHTGTEENGTTYEITIKNIEAVDKENYPPILVASYSAKLLYDNLPKSDISDDDLVNVRIESTKTANEFKYSFKDLKKIDTFLSISQEYATMIKAKEYEKMHSVYVDSKHISKEEFFDGFVKTVLVPNEQVFAQTTEINLSGFNFTEHEGIQTVEMVTEVPIGANKIIYSTIYSDSKDPKIIGISVK